MRLSTDNNEMIGSTLSTSPDKKSFTDNQNNRDEQPKIRIIVEEEKT
jgi:hypothetical protein